MEGTDFQCPVPQACCVDGACFDLTAEECEERGGQIVGDDCDDTTLVCEPVDEGACCYQGNCVGATPEQCEDQLQGTYYNDSAQCLAECAAPVGVCCMPNGTCQPNWDEYHCELAGGSWIVDGSCDETDAGVSICPQPDLIACCIREGCFEMTAKNVKSVAVKTSVMIAMTLMFFAVPLWCVLYGRWYLHGDSRDECGNLRKLPGNGTMR